MSEYQVKFETVSVGMVDFRIRSLKDRQQFSDPEGHSEEAGISSATWPLFGVVWPSAIVLANIMHTHVIENLRILEVGCGLGLASLAASRRGANITASDYHPLSDSFLQNNAALNHFPPIHFERGDWSKLNPNLGVFDLIIGSDILYERDHPELLSAFLGRHSTDHTKVIIVDPGRGHQAKFTHKMQALGYSFSAESVKKSVSETMFFKGKILTYQR